MTVSAGYQAYVIEQLAGVAPEPKRMFGGVGLFREGVMFGLIADDRVYFKVDDASRPRYLAAGSPPFEYAAGEKTLGYFEVPAEVIEDADELGEWARAAIAVAFARDAAKPARLRKRAGRAPAARRKRSGSAPRARRKRPT